MNFSVTRKTINQIERRADVCSYIKFPPMKFLVYSTPNILKSKKTVAGTFPKHLGIIEKNWLFLYYVYYDSELYIGISSAGVTFLLRSLPFRSALALYFLKIGMSLSVRKYDEKNNAR